MGTNGYDKLLSDIDNLLSKSAILEADDLPLDTVKVPEWGGSVVIRGMTGAERDAFEATIFVGKGDDRELNLHMLRAKLAAMSIVDPETHERMFNEREITLLGQKSARALQRVFDAAQELNGMTKDDVEELVGNSEGDQNDASGSDSPSPSEVAL